MKISKPELKAHQRACDLVDQHHRGESLHPDERRYILEHWNPAAEHNLGWIDAYFTPADLASEAMIERLSADRRPIHTLDLCAGTGRLARALLDCSDDYPHHITCFERCPEFVRVGQAAVPKATWICGDMDDLDRHLLPGCAADSRKQGVLLTVEGEKDGSCGFCTNPSCFKQRLALWTKDKWNAILPPEDMPVKVLTTWQLKGKPITLGDRGYPGSAVTDWFPRYDSARNCSPPCATPS